MSKGMKVIALLVVVGCVIGFALQSGAGSGLKGVWNSTEVEVAENSFLPAYRSLSFYDVSGDNGNVTFKDKSNGLTLTGRFRKSGNRLTLSFDGYKYESYTITMKGSQAFTLENSSGKILFTRQ